MSNTDLILGLFFSDENSLIYDKIKYSKELSAERRELIKGLSYKFLGAVFFTAAYAEGEIWKIEFIEASLSLQQIKINQQHDIIQSFFILNSTIEFNNGDCTNLFTLIGSPHTEDVKLIYDKMIKYIHPSIIQGSIVKSKLIGNDFNFMEYINEELNRSINLINYSLGSSRKVYWKEQNRYYCVGLIQRTISDNSEETYLYTFDKDDLIREQVLDFIPSFYIMAILPDYYEKLIKETLRLFDKKNITPNIKQIKLSLGDKEVIYLEEYLINNEGDKKSLGVILILGKQIFDKSENISFYKKNIRLNLDGHKNFKDMIKSINPKFSIIDKWSTDSSSNLNSIQQFLDKKR